MESLRCFLDLLHLLKFTAVQQGDPLEQLLFSFFGTLELIDEFGVASGLELNLWYLDEGTIAAWYKKISKVVSLIMEKGRSLSLHVNLSKCGVFGPSGNQIHPEFPVPEVHRLSDGIELLGSHVFEFFSSCFKKRVDQGLRPTPISQILKIHKRNFSC